MFPQESHCDLLKEMESQEFNQILACLSDLFTYINDLGSSFRGKNLSILNCYEKLYAFNDKLPLCCRLVKRWNYSIFTGLKKIDDNQSSNLISSVCKEIVAHLEMLSTSFNKYCNEGKMEISE